jgi:glycerol-3-phosphate dehydrogenase
VIDTLRAPLIKRLHSTPQWDIAVIGGGATGLGVALDAAARGFSVVLIESHDFAKGTSSRATKLLHGGVRYLAQGNIGLVREALHERTTLLGIAQHLAQPLPFVMPSYKFWETPFYGIGLKAYDLLAGKAGLGPTEFLSADATAELLPNLQTQGLKGGVKYWDGQFDDARLALAIAKTAVAQGALLINYCQATGLVHTDGKVTGLHCQDLETGHAHTVQARCVINATGVWVDALRQQDGQALHRPVKDMVAPSQGVHLVVDREFMPTDHALLVPKTADGRVLFAVPWLGKLILGTTDTPRHDLAREPTPFADELRFILDEAAKVLTRAPTRSDVKSIWVGLRPLVKPLDDDGGNTKALSREHTILVSQSGLVTVTGGKWTTYRAMAEDVLARCADAQLIADRPTGATAHLALAGAPGGSSDRSKGTSAGTSPGTSPDKPPDKSLGRSTGESAAAPPPRRISDKPGLACYGSEAAAVQALPGANTEIAWGLTEAMVRYAARHEYARTTEDILARRSRLLFLDAALAASVSQQVGDILQAETGIDPQVDAFKALARQYLELPG